MLKKILILAFIIVNLTNISYSEEKKDTMNVQKNQIIVSAMRYPEKLIELPMAATLINKIDFPSLRGYGMDEILNTIPGVLVQSRAGGIDNRITIRGYGARGSGDRSNSGTSRGIKIYMDGIPETEPDGRTSFDNIDFNLISSMEVLRSNASSLWGNAAGGVINISTIPQSNESFLNVEGIAGSYGLQKYTVKGGLNLGNGIAYMQASNTKYDGWRQWSDGERTIVNTGFSTTFSNMSKLNILLSLNDNRFNIAGPLTQQDYDNKPEAANSTYLTRKERRHNRLAKLGFNFEHQFDKMNSIAMTAFVNPKYLQRSERNTYRDFTRYHLGGSVNYKNELQINDELDNVFLTGFDNAYQDGAILFYNLTSDGERGNTISQNKKEGANSFGFFLQDELIYNEKISLLLGLRYDNVTYYNQDFTKLNYKDERAFEKATPKVGISYRINPDMSVYFNLGGGVEVPAGNETDPAPTFGQDSIYMLNPLLEPIVSTTYEVGTKHYIAYNGLIKSVFYDMSAFFIKVTNDIIPYSGGKFYFTAGESQRLGVELALDLDFDFGLSLMTAFTYMNSKYNDYKIDSIHYDKTKAEIYADYSDNKAAGVPDYFYNIRLKYQPEWSYNFYIELNTQGVSSYYANDANTIEVPSYNLFNMQIGMSEPYYINDNIGAKVFCSLNNLTDQKYAASSFINPDRLKNGDPVFLEPGLPRNFVLGVALNIK